MHRIFVYGTLRKGQGNHGLLLSPTTRDLGPAVTLDAYQMISLGGFPGVRHPDPPGSPASPIVGELYEVDDETLARLDLLEGYPRFYERIQVRLHLTAKPAGEHAAQMYVLARRREVGDLIPDGDWVAWERRRRERAARAGYTGWGWP